LLSHDIRSSPLYSFFGTGHTRSSGFLLLGRSVFRSPGVIIVFVFNVFLPFFFWSSSPLVPVFLACGAAVLVPFCLLFVNQFDGLPRPQAQPFSVPRNVRMALKIFFPWCVFFFPTDLFVHPSGRPSVFFIHFSGLEAATAICSPCATWACEMQSNGCIPLSFFYVPVFDQPRRVLTLRLSPLFFYLRRPPRVPVEPL